jgi:hypothetical protein
MYSSSGILSSFREPQSKRGQSGERGPVIRVKNASHPQTFRDLDKHRSVSDIDDLPGWLLGDVKRKPKDVLAELANVDEAGRNKRIHKPAQLELANPIRIQFAPFVADPICWWAGRRYLRVVSALPCIS